MTQEQFEMKVEGLLKNKEFCDKVGECTNLEQVANLFKQEGLEIEPNDVARLAQALSDSETDEIDEAELESVTGGSVIGVLIGVLELTWETLPGGKHHDRLQKVVDYWYKKGYKKGWWH